MYRIIFLMWEKRALKQLSARDAIVLKPADNGRSVVIMDTVAYERENLFGSGTQEHKCALFADDMLLFVTSPLISTPNILRTLQDFGAISGLNVNVSKSLALNISVPQNRVDQLKHHFPFPWATEFLPYLGIALPNHINKLSQITL